MKRENILIILLLGFLSLALILQLISMIIQYGVIRNANL